MSKSEQRLQDTEGRFAKVMRGGSRLTDASWTSGRVLLSDKRLVVVQGDNKRTIPLSSIQGLGGRYDVNQAISEVSNYLSLQLEDEVFLIAPREPKPFERDLFSALLSGTVLLIRHPAMKGGVVQDTEWEKARIKIDEEAINIGTTAGNFVEVNLDDIGGVDTEKREVANQARRVVEVEHSIERTSLQTYFAGPNRACELLEALFRKGAKRATAELDLDDEEKEVIMALYSGISPFDIPNFTGQDVDEVEETFEWLIEREVLDEVRKRREVVLTTRGRTLASDAINEQ